MKKITNGLIASCFVVMLMSCDSPFIQPAQDASATLSIAIADSVNVPNRNARTAIPMAPFTRYGVTISKGTEQKFLDLGLPGGAITISNPEGLWDIEVIAYIGDESIAQGTTKVYLKPGEKSRADITLGPIFGGKPGALEMSIQIPEGLDVARAIIMPADTTGDIKEIDLLLQAPEDNGRRILTQELSPGFYDLFLIIARGDLSAGMQETLHIYSTLTTATMHNFDEDDLFKELLLSGTVAPLADHSPTHVVIYDPSSAQEIGLAPVIKNNSWITSVAADKIINDIVYLKTRYVRSDGVVVFTKPVAVGVAGTGKENITLNATELEEEGEKTADENIDPQIKNTNAGRGIDLFGDLSVGSLRAGWFDLDAMIRDGVISVKDETSSIIYGSTGEQLSDVQAAFMIGVGMDASMPFKVVTLSAGMNALFETSSITHEEWKYATLRIEHTIKTIYIDTSRLDWPQLVKYVKPGLLQALDTWSVKDIVSHYGFGAILAEKIGGSEEAGVTFFNSKNESLQKFRAEFNGTMKALADSISASVKLEVESVSSTSNWQADSTFRTRRDGGALSTALNLESFMADHAPWLSTIYETPVFCGIPSYKTILTIWDLAKMLGKYEASARLQGFFIDEAIKKVTQLEESMPGEWFTLSGEEYTSGTNTFTLPKRTVDTDLGPKAVPVKTMVFICAGAGAGAGHGGCEYKWDDREHAGGGGGSSSVGYIEFVTNNDIHIDINVGQGGVGSPQYHSYSSYGAVAPPGGNGGDTTVSWNGVVLQAGGGKGGNYGPGGTTNNPDAPNGDNRGGAGGTISISGLTGTIASDYQVKYATQNGIQGKKGQDGGYTPGAGGAPVTLKGFTGAAGGRGGGASPNLNGSNGGNGRVLIRYIYYDGR